MSLLTKELIATYDIEGPRYTSYPTAPIWHSDFDRSKYGDTLEQFGQNPDPLSLYIHIPFCEKRCLFCACNVVIRKQKSSVGDDYLAYLEKEIVLICKQLPPKPIVKQIHIGGGTPTYLSDAQLHTLSELLDRYFDTRHLQEKSIEVDPRSIDTQGIHTLHKLGFNRLSFGIQDFDHNVQESVLRVQSFSDISDLIEAARSLSFKSINCDLIYGLPFQTEHSIEHTINQLLTLKPNRIALYSFAYVPWIHAHQKRLHNDLPDSDNKIALFLNARERLLDNGYIAIAMDHFALADDDLAIAYKKGSMRRNFMGYATLATSNYLGLGVSSIGYISHCFSQNTKDIKTYYANLDAGILPTERGYALSKRDIINQWVISTLMCQFHLSKAAFHTQFNASFDTYFKDKQPFLHHYENDGFIHQNKDGITVTELGRLFIRNICMGFDDYLPKKKKENQFSKTI